MNLNVSLNTETSYPDGRLFSSSRHVKVCVAASKDKRRYVSKLTVHLHGHSIWYHVTYAVIIRRRSEVRCTHFLNRLLILADATSCQYVTV